MVRQYAHTSLHFAGLITIALFLCGCVAPSLQVAVPTPQVIMQGDTPGREEVQPIELDNCNGKGDAKRIEQRTRSIESTISAEIAAKFGTSAEVLSAEVQAAVGAAMKWGAERSTSIELVAPPGTWMAFQLVWIGDEQVGIVQNLRASNIPIAFRSFKPTDVRIKSQYDIGCPVPGTQGSVATSLPPPPKAQPAVTAQPISVLLKVFANRGWQNTNILVARGNRVIVEYVSDLWFTASGDGGGRDASGGPNHWTCTLPECHEPLHDFPKYALIGKIGDSGDILKVGNYSDFVTQINGMLYLRPNYGDVDMPIFNPQGAITVRITVR